MEFNDSRVRARFLEHLTFATETVSIHNTIASRETAADPEIEALVQGMQVNLILTVLNYTLALDFRLKNSLIGEHLEEGEHELP